MQELQNQDIRTIKGLKEALSGYYGTENYFQHFTGLKYTDGIKALCDNAKCYWFLDIIASYQHTQKVKSCPFQIWRIHSSAKWEDGKIDFVDMREDTNEPPIIRQELYTNFPEGEYEVYVIDGVALLKGEY